MLLLILWGIACAYASGGGVPTRQETRDLDMYRAVVARVSSGEDYYAVVGSELDGRHYATTPVFNWRLPTLAVLQARAPSLHWSVVLLSALGLATVALFMWVLRMVGPARQALGGLLLLTLLPMWMDERPALLHDVWAGQLVALSLACWAGGLVGASLVAGAAALSVRELALVYVVVMLVGAVFEARRREAAGWAAVLLGFVAFYAWHVAHVAAFMPPDPLENAWVSLGGWCFAVATARANVVLFLAPAPLLAGLLPLMWFGLWRLRTFVGWRAAAAVSAYLALFTIVGRPDNWYWGSLVAPVLPLGLVGWFGPARAPARSTRA